MFHPIGLNASTTRYTFGWSATRSPLSDWWQVSTWFLVRESTVSLVVSYSKLKWRGLFSPEISCTWGEALCSFDALTSRCTTILASEDHWSLFEVFLGYLASWPLLHHLPLHSWRPRSSLVSSRAWFRPSFLHTCKSTRSWLCLLASSFFGASRARPLRVCDWHIRHLQLATSSPLKAVLSSQVDFVVQETFIQIWMVP